jgi:hypothetical protein
MGMRDKLADAAVKKKIKILTPSHPSVTLG